MATNSTNAIDAIKKHGLIYLLHNAFNRLVPSWLFRFAVMNVYEIDHESLRSTRPSPQVSCDIATRQGDIEALRKATFMFQPDARVKHHVGYRASIPSDAAHREGEKLELAGGVWGGTGAYFEDELGFRIDLQDHQAWVYCAYVQKAARGKGVYTNVLTFAANDLIAKGHDSVLLSVMPWNRKSITVHERLTRGPVGRIVAVRIFKCALVLAFGDLSQSARWTTDLSSHPITIHLQAARNGQL